MAERNTGVTAATDVVELGRGPARDSIIADKYRVETTLGFGGMGVVIAARHLQLDERVAIKVLRDDVTLDAEHVERFLREAQAAVRLKSEHVARVQDVGTLPDGKPFMVMELLEGLDLGRLLQDQGQLARPVAVDIVLQVCDALAEAHSLGIIHRDIKPTNLFITQRRDGSPLVKVLDFGISKAQSTAELSLTQTSSMLGTPAYMSPEQMRSARNADARSDLWSLGTVLYELVEGETPFTATSFAELCVAVATDNPRSMTHAPELQPILEVALEKSPEHRFPSIAEFALALEPLTSDPARARRQVARIFRLLGKTPPAGRDATPTPTAPHRDSRPSYPRITTFTDEVSTVARPSELTLTRKRPAWHYALWVLVLAAGAAAAVIVATAGTHDEPATVKMNATPPAAIDAPALPPSEPASTAAMSPDGSAAVSPAGPAAVSPAGSDAIASPGSAAGSNAGSAALPGRDATVPHTSPSPHHTTRPPPHHTTRPPLHVVDAPPAAGSAAASSPPPPPPPKCDPFANPKGCGPRKSDSLERP